MASDKFNAEAQKIIDLHNKKQLDYGTEGDPFANIRASADFGVAPWVGALVRLNDKIYRLKRFVEKGVLANESVEDSLQDIAVYALIGLVLYKEASGVAKPKPEDQAKLLPRYFPEKIGG